MVPEYTYSFILVFNLMMALYAKTCRQKYQNNEVLCFDCIYCNFYLLNSTTGMNHLKMVATELVKELPFTQTKDKLLCS